MKKLKICIGLLILSTTLMAQDDGYDPGRDEHLVNMVVNTATILLGFYVISSALLTLVQMFLDFKLKSRILDRGAPEPIVHQLLQRPKKDLRSTAIRWTIIMAAIGLGFAMIYLFPPFGVHSVMLMSFCISAGFLCYYLLIKKTDTQ